MAYYNQLHAGDTWPILKVPILDYSNVIPDNISSQPVPFDFTGCSASVRLKWGNSAAYTKIANVLYPPTSGYLSVAFNSNEVVAPSLQYEFIVTQTSTGAFVTSSRGKICVEDILK